MNSGSSRRLLLLWAPPVLWMAAIFTFSSLTGPELAPVSSFSTLGHFGEYAILGVLLFLAARATWDSPSLAAVLAAIVSSAYGVTDELHQFLVPGRTPDPADWLTDTAGALVAIACVLVIERLATARKDSRDAPDRPIP